MGAFCFVIQETETGLYVCLNTFLGIGKEFLPLHHRKTGNCVFLHRRIVKQPIEDQEQEPHPKKITKLAIGLEGGFNPNGEDAKYHTTETNTLVVYPSFKQIALDSPDLPDNVAAAVSALLAADSASRLEELQDLVGTWDGEKLSESKFARDLVQLGNGKKIPPNGWKCEKCDLKENLWLNLTDGSILCGRKFFDGTGGNNHAVEHYHEFKYPLAVKLGTITPTGGDVYSYEEDAMVEDPLLAQHLAHFGINIAQMEKSDKSMIELEIDYNQRIGEWSILTEANSVLQPLYGPGYTGLANLGNSCYLNSVVQVIFSIPEFRGFFYPPNEIFQNSPEDPSCDFNIQMAKLAYGIYSGKYSQPPNPDAPKQEVDGIKPQMFKSLIGRGHPEFSSKRQQDAQEFLLHLINSLDRNFRIQGNLCNPTKALAFQVEDRIECTSSSKVNYTTRTEYVLPLPIPMDKVLNSAELAACEEKKKQLQSEGKQLDPNEVVRPKIALSDCFDAFIAAEIIEDFYSTAIQGKTKAKKTSKLKTFPDFLFLQIKKFALGEDWLPKKLDVSLEVDECIDLSRLRSAGLQPNEEVLPDRQIDSGSGSSSRSSSLFISDPSSLAQVNTIVEMGYSMDAAKRAVYYTNGTGLDAALSWLYEHQDDRDLNEPFTLDQADVAGASASAFSPDQKALETLINMGLPEASALRGLRETNNNVERAIEWIFSHPDEPSAAPAMVDDSAPLSESAVCRDGNEKYRLVAFISHMGSSTLCGHYVAHILKDGKWVIFNDSKVAVSERPPKELAYLYLYARQ